MSVWLAINLLAIALVLGLMARVVLPPSNLVRVRNALLLQPSSANDFAWMPPAYPPGFRLERQPATKEFTSAVVNLALDPNVGDWQRALAIAAHLTECAQDKGPIQSGLLRTYLGIRAGYGYCADFTKVFLGLAHAARLAVRQWSFSFDGFGGHGHVMVEVFDRQRGRWLWIDVYNNFHACDPATNEPLSALELRESLLGQRPKAILVINGAGRPGYTIKEKAWDYYVRGAAEWYLWWGNDVFAYDAHPLVSAANRFSGGLGQIAATVVGVHPSIRILETHQNASTVASIFRLRQRVKILFGALVALAVLLIVQLFAGVSYSQVSTTR